MLPRKPVILIAHRGNLSGPSPQENSPSHVAQALDAGFEVEIDLWQDEGKLKLGHDGPQYGIERDFLKQDGLWIHCKNQQALRFAQELCNDGGHFAHLNFFWHETDAYTLTSQGNIWTYPGKDLPAGAIAVCPEMLETTWDMSSAGGICSDYVGDILAGEMTIKESLHQQVDALGQDCVRT